MPHGSAVVQLFVGHYTSTILLARDSPHRPKPNRERFASVLEDGPGRYRALTPATRTLQQHPAYGPGLPPATPRTPKTFRPPQPDQIFPASCLRRKARFKFGQISWIILHGSPYYILGLPESSRYTNYPNCWVCAGCMQPVCVLRTSVRVFPITALV